MVETKRNGKTKSEPDTGAGANKKPGAPVTYTFDGRDFVVEPVFKNKAPNTVSDILLRLMRSDLEES